MQKNWLVRTRSNLLLGPVSKKKIIELYKSGTIKKDDEVCSGNGYWFYIKEEELVQEFILGDAKQPYNPVRDSDTVIANGKFLVKDDAKSNKTNEEIKFPDQGDLEYPSLDGFEEAPSGPVDVENSSYQISEETPAVDSSSDRIAKEQSSSKPTIVVSDLEDNEEYGSTEPTTQDPNSTLQKKKSSRKIFGIVAENRLNVLTLIAILIAAWGLYKNFSTIKNMLVNELSGKLIDEADAQTLIPAGNRVKKKL